MENEINKNQPKVSVIIPLHNQKQFIGDAINSVLNQTYLNIEIIVVNDGSTDNPFPILEEYKDKIVLINQKNKGLAGARNEGIKHSSGEYIQFLDADDFLNKDKIKLQLEFAEIQNAAVSYCEIAQYENDSKHSYLKYIGEVKDMFSCLYNFWQPYPLPVHSLLLKREIFKKFGLFDEELKACEDRHFLSRIAAAGGKFNYFPFIGGFRRIHQFNMNIDRLHIIENTVIYYKKINRELGENFFIEKYGYTGHQMMCANLTYIYGLDIARGIEKAELKKISNILKNEDINFFAEPIPLDFEKYKLRRFFFNAHLRRCWKKLLKGIKPKI